MLAPKSKSPKVPEERMKMGTATQDETRAELCLVTERGRIKVAFCVAVNNIKRSDLVGRNEFPL